MVHNFNRALFDDTSSHGRVTKVLACLDQALIIEAYRARMHKASLNQCGAELASRLEFCLTILVTTLT